MDFKKICYNCMKEKPEVGGVCPYCGFKNEDYKHSSNHFRPLTPLNGKYLLGRTLGAGGFGITYIALDMHLQVVVAIKELYLKNISVREDSNVATKNFKDKVCFEENKKRFLQEARVLAMFNEKDSEGIVIVKDHFEENNTAYIVMEYLNGDTLKNHVKKSKLSFEQTKIILEPVIKALNKIHQLGVVHLDISPDNIMLMENNRAKLLDFGGAKTIGEKDDNDIVAFKRGYAPPEQYVIDGNIGQWTDVYAVAATIYYSLTGMKPVDSMERKAGTELVRPSKMGARIPQNIENVLMKALEIDINKRYQTLEAFWQDINNKKVKNVTPAVEKSKTQKSSKNVWILVGTISVAIIMGIIAMVVLMNPFKRLSTNSNMSLDNIVSNTESMSIEESETYVEEVSYEPGDIIEMELGTYIFQNVSNQDYIMGIENGYGDDGASLMLVPDEEANRNRFFVTNDNASDSFYNLKAVHTNSFISTQESNALGEILGQYSSLADNGTQNWSFVYCGHDEEVDMDKVILQNENGLVMAPLNGQVDEYTQVVLTEFNMEDDSQKWFVRWSEKDISEQDVVVYNEGDLVESLSGTYNISSALDGMTSMCLNNDTNYHPEPTVVVFKAEWLTTDDDLFQFELVPTGFESRYRIYPKEQYGGNNMCLEYNADTSELVMREESSNVNQLFRIVYVKKGTYLIQTYDESCIGFDLDNNGEAVGVSVLSRPYDAVADSRLESWLFKLPNEKEE